MDPQHPTTINPESAKHHESLQGMKEGENPGMSK